MLRALTLGGDVVNPRHLLSVATTLRYRHAYLMGRTGKGKSTLLHRMIQEDAASPYAVVVFDAGDLALSLVETFDEEMLKRVIFFSVDHPTPYNPLLRRLGEPGRLENELYALIDQVTTELSSTSVLSARMKRVLSVGIRETLLRPAPSLATLTTYLLEHRSEVRKRLELREDEFTIAFEGVIDRLSQFLRDPRIRRVVCAEHQLNFEEIIDTGKILIVSLAGLEKPLVRFLGTLLFHGLSATVLERPVWQRKPVAVFVDEFQDYIGSLYAVANFQTLFAQGRRYLTALTVAHQDFGTIDARLLHTIHANASVLVTFGCGHHEAEAMSKIFGAKYPPETVGFLPDYQAIARVGDVILHFETFPPPPRLREIVPDEGLMNCDDPPDPIEEFTSRRLQRDPYRDARKPRRTQSMLVPEANT